MHHSTLKTCRFSHIEHTFFATHKQKPRFVSARRLQRKSMIRLRRRERIKCGPEGNTTAQTERSSLLRSLSGLVCFYLFTGKLRKMMSGRTCFQFCCVFGDSGAQGTNQGSQIGASKKPKGFQKHDAMEPTSEPELKCLLTLGSACESRRPPSKKTWPNSSSDLRLVY